MNNIQNKLRDSKNKLKRERFLAALDSRFSDFLAGAEFSNELSCIRYAAFPKWDPNADVLTTTRGAVADWKNFTFRTWQEVMALLGRFKKIKNYIGWFFVDPDGPYYRISLHAFFANIESISAYGTAHEHYDFGWVGADDDLGIIIRYNHAAATAKKFELCIWGL